MAATSTHHAKNGAGRVDRYMVGAAFLLPKYTHCKSLLRRGYILSFTASRRCVCQPRRRWFDVLSLFYDWKRRLDATDATALLQIVDKSVGSSCRLEIDPALERLR
jgi:hypothetical protein